MTARALLSAVPAGMEAGALSEFSLRAARRGLIGFVLLFAAGFALLGWRGWLQHMVELWTAYAVAFLLLAWLRRLHRQWIPAPRLLLVLLAGPLFGAALSTPLAFLPSLPEDRNDAAVLGHLAVNFLFALALAAMQISFGLVLQRQRRQAETRQRALVLEREVLASHLSVLQAQIEPHFLYNTLANVQALTRRDPAAAETMLAHLIDYLRAAMPAMRGRRSTLEQELRLASAYLSIMKIRMGERLQFSAQAPAHLLACEFPPTVIGTLIENAIKHGLEPSKRGGRIDVTAWHDGRTLWVQVADTGAGFSASSGSGVGLANARERLQMLYGPSAELDLGVNEPSGVVARVGIPVSLPAAPMPQNATVPPAPA